MIKSKFFDSIRNTIALTDKNVKGFDLILDEGANRKVPLHYLAYILATVYHETAATMQPIREYGGDKYLKKKKYWPYVGMGYVQLTWLENYKKASSKLGVDFVKHPKKLLEPEYALPILFIGMDEGWFTGKSLKDYIDLIDENDKEDLREFSNARRIINGTDRQVLIGQYAITFEKALKAAGYGLEPTQKPIERQPDDPGVDHTEKPKTSPNPFMAILEAILMIFSYFSKGNKNV